MIFLSRLHKKAWPEILGTGARKGEMMSLLLLHEGLSAFIYPGHPISFFPECSLYRHDSYTPRLCIQQMVIAKYSWKSAYIVRQLFLQDGDAIWHLFYYPLYVLTLWESAALCAHFCSQFFSSQILLTVKKGQFTTVDIWNPSWKNTHPLSHTFTHTTLLKFFPKVPTWFPCSHS